MWRRVGLCGNGLSIVATADLLWRRAPSPVEAMRSIAFSPAERCHGECRRTPESHHQRLCALCFSVTPALNTIAHPSLSFLGAN